MTHAEIELLRLTGWCRNLPAGLGAKFHSHLFSPETISPLQEYGFLKLSKDSRSFKLTSKGFSLLNHIGFPLTQEAKPPAKKKLERRLQAAEILLTFHRAGIFVFGESLNDLVSPKVYLSSAPIRRFYRERRSNVFAGARFAGFGRNGDTAYLVHYADMGRMYYKSETRQFVQIIHPYECEPALVLAGSTYADVAEIVHKEPPDDGKKIKNNAFSYHKILKMTTMPVHLLECSDSGTMQLLILYHENYRTLLIRALFGEHWRPPHPGVQESDGSLPNLPHEPFLIALDMDVKRIERVLSAAEQAGFTRTALFAMESQKAALESLFGNRVVILHISESYISAALGGLSLYKPPAGAYITREGGVVDAAAFRTDHKSGKQIGATMQKEDKEIL